MLTDKEAGEVNKNGGAGTGTTDTGLGGAGTGAGLGAGASRQKGNVRSGDGRGDSRNVTANYTAALIYNPPQRDENCRICLTLEADGDTTDLYDDHTQNFATGCPRLAAMSQKDKNVIVRKAKLCINCLDPEFVYKFGNFHKQCPVREKKRHYTCKAVKCRTHYWLCDYKDHDKFNAKKIEAEKKLWSGRGKLFANACSKVEKAV